MSLSQYFYVALAFVVSVLMTAVTMPWLLRFCKKRGLFDMPNARKIHHNKIPRLGGVIFAPALIVSVGVVVIVMMLRGQTLFQLQLSTYLLFSGLFMIFVIGLIDDVLGLAAKIKFVVQLVAALFMPLCNLYINNLYGFCGIGEIPPYIGYPLTIFISLLIVNAINLIDGIDGLAGGLGLLTVSIFSGLYLNLGVIIYPIVTFAMLGTLLVFLYYNLCGKVEKGTKTFMGDTGSLILGYVIAYLCIKYAMSSSSVLPARLCPILVSFTLVIVPVFDLIRVAIARLWRGTGMFCADKTHIHHLCLAAGMSMHTALAFILCLQAGFDVANYVLFVWGGVCSTWLVFLDVAAYLCIIAVIKLVGKKKQ